MVVLWLLVTWLTLVNGAEERRTATAVQDTISNGAPWLLTNSFLPATADLTNDYERTQILQLSNFGFQIPGKMK